LWKTDNIFVWLLTVRKPSPLNFQINIYFGYKIKPALTLKQPHQNFCSFKSIGRVNGILFQILSYWVGWPGLCFHCPTVYESVNGFIKHCEEQSDNNELSDIDGCKLQINYQLRILIFESSCPILYCSNKFFDVTASFTCILASERLVRKAKFSRTSTSGYCCSRNVLSSASSCCAVNAVRLLRCFRGKFPFRKTNSS